LIHDRNVFRRVSRSYPFSFIVSLASCSCSAEFLMPVSIQMLDPSLTTPSIRSIRNQPSNSDPIVAKLCYHFSQLCVFFHCPFVCVGRGPNSRPSLTTPCIRSSLNQRSNSDSIIAAVFLYRISQLCVFFWRPFTCADVGVQRLVPPTVTFFIRADLEPERQLRPMCCRVSLPLQSALLLLRCPCTLVMCVHSIDGLHV
jgi:hypothetical protein